jgi:hypothetical protein
MSDSKGATTSAPFSRHRARSASLRSRLECLSWIRVAASVPNTAITDAPSVIETVAQAGTSGIVAKAPAGSSHTLKLGAVGVPNRSDYALK